MSSPVEISLPKLFERIAERHPDKSIRQLSTEAKKAGTPISHTTLAELRGGSYNNTPGKPVLRAIAYLAGVSEETAYAAGGVPNLHLQPFGEQVEEAGGDSLDPEERRAVLGVIRAFANRRRGRAGRIEMAHPPGGSDVRVFLPTDGGTQSADKAQGDGASPAT